MHTKKSKLKRINEQDPLKKGLKNHFEFLFQRLWQKSITRGIEIYIILIYLFWPLASVDVVVGTVRINKKGSNI